VNGRSGKANSLAFLLLRVSAPPRDQFRLGEKG